jgi:hypothetical protein
MHFYGVFMTLIVSSLQRLLMTLLPLMLAATSLQAAADVPVETGWSGHVNVGVGVGQSESNMNASILSIDLGDDTISSIDESPGSEDIVMPAFQFEVAYTLGDSQTQFYLGNQVADFISFDLETTLETHAGVRQQIAGIGIVDFSFAKSSFPTDVWKDPYIAGSPRGDTERTSLGLQLGWSKIMETPLEFEFSAMEIEIDDEESGASLVADGALNAAEQRLLKREGQIYRSTLQYNWEINERHRLVPGIAYLDYDLDGAAMAEDGISLQLKYYYSLNRWRLVSQLFYRDMESDETNPIYDDSRDMETIGAVFTAFYAEPFGLKNWTANATASYTDGDSNIDFYDSSFGLVSVGMLYRFD